jgi:hypothetical protein
VADLKEILLNKNVVIPKDYETFKNIFRHFKGKRFEGIQGDDGPLMDRADEFYLKPPSAVAFSRGISWTTFRPYGWEMIVTGILTPISLSGA